MLIFQLTLDFVSEEVDLKSKMSTRKTVLAFIAGIALGYGFFARRRKGNRIKHVEEKVEDNGRVMFVTGAASGIGRATLLLFLRKGYRVVGVDIDAEGLRKLPQSDRLHTIVADVGSEDDVRRAVREAVSEFGRIDCAFNNAGIEGERSKIYNLSSKSFERVLRVNLVSQFLCMKYEIQQMIKQQREENNDDPMIDRYNFAIINTSSTAGLAAMPEFSAYCTSKFGIVGLTRCAAKEYANRGIRVNSICPSTTRTSMVQRFTEQYPEWQRKQNASFPVGRIAEPDEIANAVLWLASKSCRFMTGTELVIDGGASA